MLQDHTGELEAAPEATAAGSPYLL